MPQSDQCLTCRHYWLGAECAAFPDGIPAEIFTGLRDHRKPYPGDKGIRWEPRATSKPRRNRPEDSASFDSEAGG